MSITEETDPTSILTLTSTSERQERTLDYDCYPSVIRQPNTHHHGSIKEISNKQGHSSLLVSNEPPSHIHTHNVCGDHIAAWTSILTQQ